MKKLTIVAFLFCLQGTIANANDDTALFQANKPIQCGNVKEILKSLAGERWREIPLWTGFETDSTYSVFHNESTGTWTLLQFNNEYACILGTGSKSQSLIKQNYL